MILQLGLHILPRLKLTVSSLRNHPAIVVFFIQAATTVAASIVGYVVSSPLHAISVMIGGSVAIIPQSLFGFWVFRQRGARKARAMVTSLFVGEGLKLSIVAVLFAVVWANSDYLETEAVIAGFVITVLVGQLSPPLILVGHEQINRKQ